jgi:DtxR family Mn-dependent transcriptional regulator
MRLTEEIIELLKSLAQGTALSVAPEILEEAEHEGWIARNGHPAVQLTALGHETLQAIRQRLLSADQLNLEQARIAYISQRNYARFQKLLSFGLARGVPIKLQQRFPSFVVQCEETQIALEEDIARDIFVWRD